MELTFDQAAELLDEMAEQFPPVFFDELNGGILLEEEAKCDPMFPEGEVYFMGEYIQDGYLGNSIQLYYGSFLASALLLGFAHPVILLPETLQEGGREAALAHELTHHVEHLANAHGLDDKDEEQLLQLMQEYAEGN